MRSFIAAISLAASLVLAAPSTAAGVSSAPVRVERRLARRDVKDQAASKPQLRRRSSSSSRGRNGGWGQNGSSMGQNGSSMGQNGSSMGRNGQWNNGGGFYPPAFGGSNYAPGPFVGGQNYGGGFNNYLQRRSVSAGAKTAKLERRSMSEPAKKPTLKRRSFGSSQRDGNQFGGQYYPQQQYSNYNQYSPQQQYSNYNQYSQYGGQSPFTATQQYYPQQQYSNYNQYPQQQYSNQYPQQYNQGWGGNVYPQTQYQQPYYNNNGGW